MIRRAGLCVVVLGVTGCGAGQAGKTASEDTVQPIVISSGGEAPVGTPYSQREHYEHVALLARNGVPQDRAALRRAAAAGDAALRAAACAVLAEAPVVADRLALEAAFSDAPALAKAWAALGLARLGDPKAVSSLAALAAAPATDTDHSPLVAAAALARLGDATGVPVLAAAMANDDLRLDASRRLLEISRVDATGALPLFERALRDDSAAVRSLALSQLEELRAPAARPMLEAFVRGTPDEGERERAEDLLRALPP